MKNLIRKTLLLAFIAAGLSSCTEDTKDPVGEVKKDIVLSSPETGTYQVAGATAAANVFTAKWSAAEFSYNASITYKLQIVKSDAEYPLLSKGLVLGTFAENSGTDYEQAITQKQLNTYLLSTDVNAAVGVAQTFKARIIGVASTEMNSSSNNFKAVSQDVTLTITPYDAFDEFARIYVPGNYGAASTYADWAPDNAAKLFSKAGDGKYEGFVWMNNATPAFKFTEDATWTNDKGDIAENPNSFTDLVHTGGKDIKPADGAGTYFFTVDWNTNKYTVGKRQVAIIGPATPNGWTSPTYLNFETNAASPYYRMYTLDLTLAQDEFLIRLKDDWSEKMGTISGANTAETVPATNPYKVKIGGGNMKAPAAGNYKIVLDIRNSANYNLRLIPN